MAGEAEKLNSGLPRTTSEAGRKKQYLSNTGDQKGKYHCNEKMVKYVVLYLKGRRILRNSEITKILADEFDRMKEPGARKFVYSLRENVVRLSQSKIEDILNRDKPHYRRNARFL